MSRLDSFIRRLEAQRACLDRAAALVAGLAGPVLELGLGNGRTYDHLRALLPGRDIFVFERAVSAHPEVRAELVQRQQAWADGRGGGVVEGRDIGTVVFPDADPKVFLTASEEERARRRQKDEDAPDVAAVAADLARRDALDSSRTVSPLKPADDAVVIDTSARTVDDVVAEVVGLLS